MSPVAKLFKWGTCVYEAFLALPVLGGLFIIANGWVPLAVAFLLHAVAIVILQRERKPIVGNVLGTITSILAFIPLLGWIMHGITALVLLVEGISSSRQANRY
ncbi:hypothetical protein [Paenibacillus sp. FSL R5-0914]|uniref:hypothetical protein n=1 Tax=Paenibacillus sp. FSL R5-0914 TaxID=2921665 RepID=UPI0030FC6DAB